jgi:hypothetical protein
MQRNIEITVISSPVSSRYFTPNMKATYDTVTKQARLGDAWFPVDERWEVRTKGTLTWSRSTSATIEEVKRDYPDAEVEEIEFEYFHITVPLENIDPVNPYLAMEQYQTETGEDCWEVFTIRLENGLTFTEEKYEG